MSGSALLIGGLSVAAAAAAYVLLKKGQKPKGVLVARLEDIPAGSMKEVKVDDKTILLVHTATGNIYATSSKCTHYGAPLVKGVLSGNRIVCPWHAACFDACTGDIEDGPVLDALMTFPVEVDPATGSIYVDGTSIPARIPRGVTPKMAACNPQKDPRHFVVLGAGAAGAAAVESLRREGFQGRITMVERDTVLPYDRTKLSKNMEVSGDELLLRPAAFYEQHGVSVILGRVVTRVDTKAHEVVLDNGEKLSYSKLLCCTGGPARTFRAPEAFVIPGAEADGVFPLRDAPHSKGIEDVLRARGVEVPIVIVGSSFIGMEAAAYLAKNKKCTDITVVGMEAEPFERVLGSAIGACMRQLHEAQSKGVVKFRMRATVREFHRDASGHVEAVTLSTGERLASQLVIIGAGIIPSVEYLRQAEDVQLLAKAPGGVCVDETLRAGEDVYAAGDIAFFPYAHAVDSASSLVRIEHWDVAMDQGRVAAVNMLDKDGTKARPFDTIPFFWTAQYGKSLRYAGYATRTDNVIIHGSLDASGGNPVFSAYFVVNDAVAAVATMGRDPQGVAAMELLRRKWMPSPKQLAAAESFDLVEYLRQRSLEDASPSQ